MAIDAYTGLPRSGKSYSVVKNVILPSLKEGRHVYTNIPLSESLHDEFPGQIHQLDAEWFKDMALFSKIPAGAVCVLDELWRRWPSGMKANNVNFADKEFLAEHGHNVDANGHTTRVVLVSQDLSQIASFARDLVDTTYRSTKLDQVGAKNRFRVDIYRGAVTGQRPPKSQLTRSTFDQYEESIYRYYKSATKSQAGNAGDESRADKRANIWRSPFIIFSILGPIVGIPLALWFLFNLFSSGFGATDKAKAIDEAHGRVSPAMINPAPPVASQAVSQQVEQVETVDYGPQPSGTWRVAGFMQWNLKEDGVMRDVVVLASQMVGLRYVDAAECELAKDGFNWSCEVDGFMVTAWTGRGDYSTFASNPVTTTTRVARVASGATNTSNAVPVNPAPARTN